MANPPFNPSAEGNRWQALFHLDYESRAAGVEPLSSAIYMREQVKALVRITHAVELEYKAAIASSPLGKTETLTRIGQELEAWKKRLRNYRDLADAAFDPYDPRELEWTVIGPLYFGVYDGPPVGDEGVHDVTTPYALANMLSAYADHESAMGLETLADDLVESAGEVVVASAKAVAQTSPALFLWDVAGGLGGAAEDVSRGVGIAIGVGLVGALTLGIGYGIYKVRR